MVVIVAAGIIMTVTIRSITPYVEEQSIIMKCMAKNIKKTFIFKYQGDACNMRIIILHCDW